MTNLDELLDICEKEDITVFTADCPASGSMSLLDDGKCYIAVDSATKPNELLERHAHEIGHCIKGAFYNRYSHFDIISRHEARADKWAVEKLIPKEELKRAIEQNNDTIYLLAEYFGVSEDFMIKACKHYGFYNEAI